MALTVCAVNTMSWAILRTRGGLMLHILARDSRFPLTTGWAPVKIPSLVVVNRRRMVKSMDVSQSTLETLVGQLG